MFVVDTNVLVYAADAGSEPHSRCRAKLEAWRLEAAPWYLTWGVVYEFLRVVTHPKVFRRPWTSKSAWGFIESLRSAPGLEILVEGANHSEIVAAVVRELPDLSGNLWHDAHTVALMREHGIRTIWTRDTDFHRFPSVEVRDPLR